ncbi:MAG: hypothetical protein M4579_006450 [Chaenotheca gracillima]|nr:MAG: hypothetical protein M4579_006450 [Chaenotheca gracillima]
MADYQIANDLSLHGSVLGDYLPEIANSGDLNSQRGDPPPFPILDMTISASSPCSLSEKQQGEKEFSSLLEHCAKLQRHVRETMDTVSYSNPCDSIATATLSPAVSPIQLREMLGEVNASCNFVFDIYGQGVLSKPAAQLRDDVDPISASLTTVLVLKVFQVCDAVLSSNVLEHQELNGMFFRKRLDYNITQVKIVMSKVEELTQGGVLVSRNVATIAAYIEKRLKTTS